MFFSTAIIHAQDTLHVKERRFFKNMYLVNEYSMYFPLSTLDVYPPFYCYKIGIAKISTSFRLETGFNLAWFLHRDNNLYQTSVAYNLLKPFKKQHKWSLFMGLSHFYTHQYKWGVTYEGKYNDGFVDRYYGVELVPNHKNYHLLSLDLQLLYKRFAFTYNYANYTTHLNSSLLKDGISRFSVSYYQPLFKNKETSHSADSIGRLSKNALSVSFALSQHFISAYSIESNVGPRPPYSPRTDDRTVFSRVPNIKIGLAYLYKNLWQQATVNGPIVSTVEYSISYNLQPLFNNHKPSFTGLDLGYHFVYMNQSDWQDDETNYLLSNFHLGILHITNKNILFGLYNYSLLPKILQTKDRAAFFPVHIELRFGYNLNLWKKKI